MLPDVGSTSLFAGMAFSLTASAIFLTGMFPVGGRVRNMQRGMGGVLVALCALTVVLLVIALAATAFSVQWPFLVIAGGLAFLVTPMIYQALPIDFLEGPIGAILMISANLALVSTTALQVGLLPGLASN